MCDLFTDERKNQPVVGLTIIRNVKPKPDDKEVWEGGDILDGVDVGRHVELRKVIVDKDVTIPEGTKIGIDPEHDRARGFVVTESGLTVVGKGQLVVP